VYKELGEKYFSGCKRGDRKMGKLNQTGDFRDALLPSGKITAKIAKNTKNSIIVIRFFVFLAFSAVK
jgi:hypothetical protein